jgi:hypothetical protein
MSSAKRWLDELPLSSSERELLLVGKSARPAEGAIDANWRALCVALGTTAAAAGTASASVAGNALSASSGNLGAGAAGAAGSKVAGVGLLITVGKSLALGVVVGLAAMGAGSWAKRSLTADAPAKSASQTARSLPAPRTATEPRAIPSAAAERTAALPVAPAHGALPAAASARERSAVSPTLGQPSARALSAGRQASSANDQTASLSQQARELAEFKRLIDNGAPSEALRRLEQSFNTDAASSLAEERDALYVQALARAQRLGEARAFARRFLARYPQSPYFEVMRQLLSEQ